MHPELPPGTISGQYGDWKPEKDPAEANRRSVYIFEKRVMTYPMFEAFDALIRRRVARGVSRRSSRRRL